MLFQTTSAQRRDAQTCTKSPAGSKEINTEEKNTHRLSMEEAVHPADTYLSDETGVREAIATNLEVFM